MGGALIQLVAYGIQDLYLTGDPQITFFKILYRRHTNFAIESIAQQFTAAGNFGEIVSCNISRLGDLVERIFLYIEIPSIPRFINGCTGEEDLIKKFAWVNNLGYALVQEITIEIGGKLIDKQYGEWMYIWSQVSNRQDIGLNKMIGNVPAMFEFSNGKSSYGLYIPIEFWFCRHVGLSLPIISLASSDVKINITFRRLEECIRIGPTHSIEVIDNVVPFKPGDYIQQIINGQPIYGYVINFDYLCKKLYYIKIQSPTAIRKVFESCNSENYWAFPDRFNSNLDNVSQLSDVANRQYRIYNSITGTYCTPRPGAKEMIENTTLPYKPHFINSFLYVNFIYLDKEERLKFARSNQEYLIEQIQFNQTIGIRSPNVKQNLTLNHPCKSHYWVAQLDCLVGPGTINDLFNYTSTHINFPDEITLSEFIGGRLCSQNCYPKDYSFPKYLIKNKLSASNKPKNLVKSAILLLNGHKRFRERYSEYFNFVQPFQHHYRGPKLGINMYSFCLNPEDIQPSAALNMSKIDTASMNMHLQNIINPQNTCRVRSYTINYNILRVCYNLGGLAFV